MGTEIPSCRNTFKNCSLPTKRVLLNNFPDACVTQFARIFRNNMNLYYDRCMYRCRQVLAIFIARLRGVYHELCSAGRVSGEGGRVSSRARSPGIREHCHTQPLRLSISPTHTYISPIDTALKMQRY